MDGFTLDQWLVLFLAFLLGLFLGMALLAGGKWKRRYKEEVRRREALEMEVRQFRSDRAERGTVDRPLSSDADGRAAAIDEERRSGLGSDRRPGDRSI